MKRHTTGKNHGKGQTKTEPTEPKLLALGSSLPATAKLTVGLDLGDRASCYCVLDQQGEVIARGEVVIERQPLQVLFAQLPASVVALEVGTHSPCIGRLLAELGHEPRP